MIRFLKVVYDNTSHKVSEPDEIVGKPEIGRIFMLSVAVLLNNENKAVQRNQIHARKMCWSQNILIENNFFFEQ